MGSFVISRITTTSDTRSNGTPGPTLHHHHYRPLLFFTTSTIIPHSLSLSLSKYTPFSLSNRRFFPSPDHQRFSFPMAQKREKEETELKVPETLTLCTPSIAGATNKITGSDEHRSSSPDRSDLKPGAIVDSRLSSASSPELPDLHQKTRSPTAEAPISGSDENRSSSPERSGAAVDSRLRSGSSPKRLDLNQDESNKVKRREINRCAGCRRKVGLIGFRCRCGELFCSDHRYSDRHDCSYDYKAAGREAIARENPVVRAAKILKV